MAELSEAIECLYTTFAVYPKPERIDYCPCGCTQLAEVEPLLARPLRELRFDDLGNYSFSAMTTQGNVNDFRYLLPRLFDGVVNEPFGYNCEILFGKLKLAKWFDWPVAEIAAIQTFLHTLWQTALQTFPLQDRFPAFFEIGTVVASIAVTGERLDSYLLTWDKTQTMEANKHLIQMVTLYGTGFSADGNFRAAFWANVQAQAQSLLNWLTQSSTLRRIRTNAYLLAHDGFEHMFEPSLAALEALAREHPTSLK